VQPLRTSRPSSLMVVWIASYPRSGNTLVRMLFRYGFGLSTYSIFDDPMLVREGSATTVGHLPLPGDPEELAGGKELYLVKTHRLEDAASPHPAIYIARDGRDALVSCAHYQLRYGGSRLVRRVLERLPRSLRDAAFRRALARMIDDVRFGGWSRNVGTWHARGSPTVTVRYEDLLRAPLEVLRAACTEIGVDARGPSSDLPSFQSLSERWPGMFRRGVAGAWRDEMPDDMHEAFWRRHSDGMRLLGYARGGT
jgi:hypothetical protein